MIVSVSPGRACSPACSSLQSVARETLGLSSAATSPRWLRQLPQYRSAFAPPRTRYAPSGPNSPSSSRTFHSSTKLNQSIPRISYRVAASSSGKGRRFLPAKNAYDFDPRLHDVLGVAVDTESRALRRKRRPDSGEDAFFVSKVGRASSSSIAFAVADGVGGWAESRVDPADFSHGLCGYMAQTALDWDQPAERLRPKNLLQAGYDQVVADDTIRAGGSTASVGIGLEDGRIELANLGDSGSVLLRQAAVHHYSIAQTHGFNTPFQLSIIPPRMRAQASIFGGAFLEDFPRDAVATHLHMQHGDVLMLATDGVFDNLNNQDILKLITSRMVLTGAWTATPNVGITPSDALDRLTGPEGLSSLIPSSSDTPQSAASTAPVHAHTLQSVLAATIAGEAKLASMDLRRDSPFAKEAQRYYPGDHYRGGKVDDITVLIIVAVEQGS
ncbi:hypothetical protein P175DRAFT_0429365 [Aspergillus ochraceoroseus IBT 24754]|uniref:Protein phosphatase n=2 Tax=Aspergillus ochraceoroseus TaxID=138278 RepID=A0A2T5M5N3_9EURO|nr:uncharacterized protein P175DRAFT_0429365 [Aspergillus ochraceoroseus IBT 24754]KKK24325.1 hypothetical protein AOCH_002110 [Aspergillus ochraceoroseus]PTU23845.1 hypothetical protein P175DRAFT_0429365 [Aspergillus ochraceoroseus IBT 24754]